MPPWGPGGQIPEPLSIERHFLGCARPNGVRSTRVEGSGLRSPMVAPTFPEPCFGHPSRTAVPFQRGARGFSPRQNP